MNQMWKFSNVLLVTPEHFRKVILSLFFFFRIKIFIKKLFFIRLNYSCSSSQSLWLLFNKEIILMSSFSMKLAKSRSTQKHVIFDICFQLIKLILYSKTKVLKNYQLYMTCKFFKAEIMWNDGETNAIPTNKTWNPDRFTFISINVWISSYIV